MKSKLCFRTVLLAILITVAVGLAGPAQAVSASRIDGSWIGKLDVGNGASLHVVVHIAGSPGALTGSLESPDQGPGAIPLDSVSLSGNAFAFKSAQIDAEYAGTVTASGTSIIGTFTQHGVLLALTFTPYTAAAGQKISPDAAAEIIGTWVGKIAIGNGMSLRAVFTFTRSREGVLTGTMTSPDQSGIAVPAQPRFSGRTLDLTVPSNGGSYHGALETGGRSMHGTWSQHGSSLTLDLVKTDQSQLPLRRPQEPQPPYPYAVEAVRFTNTAANVTLAGTLTKPKGGGPFPAVALISGSGPNDRDETVFGHKPFLVLADYLTRRGIAVLRYDKRGVGGSTGNYGAATSADFAGDALAAVAYLKSRSDIVTSRIGLIGHSEGGMLVQICAARSSDVDYIVILAGDGVRGDKLLERQFDAIEGVEGIPEAPIIKNTKLIGDVYSILTSGLNSSDENAELKVLQKQSGGSSSVASALSTPWFRYFLTYDPEPTLEKVTCPVLALDGSKDLQVDAAQNLPAIEAALKAGGNKDYTVQELPGLNHLFQPAKTGSPAEYAEIETTIDPSVLSIVGDWVEAHVKA